MMRERRNGGRDPRDWSPPPSRVRDLRYSPRRYRSPPTARLVQRDRYSKDGGVEDRSRGRNTRRGDAEERLRDPDLSGDDEDRSGYRDLRRGDDGERFQNRHWRVGVDVEERFRDHHWWVYGEERFRNRDRRVDDFGERSGHRDWRVGNAEERFRDREPRRSNWKVAHAEERIGDRHPRWDDVEERRRIRTPPSPREPLRMHRYLSSHQEIERQDQKYMLELNSVNRGYGWHSNQAKDRNYGDNGKGTRFSGYDTGNRDRDREGGTSRSLFQFSDDLLRGESASLKFQWDHLSDPPRIGGVKHSDDYGIGNARVSNERDYHGSRYLDTSLTGSLVETKPFSFDDERERIYSLNKANEFDASFPGGSSGNGDSIKHNLISHYPSTELHRDEALHVQDERALDKSTIGRQLSSERYDLGMKKLMFDRQLLAEEYKEEENLSLRYSKYDSDYKLTSLSNMSESIFKNNVPGPFRENNRVTSEGAGFSMEMINTPIGYDSYGQNSSTKIAVDPNSDTRNYSRSYLSPSRETAGEGKSDRHGAGQPYMQMIGVGEDHTNQNISRSGIVDSLMEGHEFPRQETMSVNRIWDHLPSCADYNDVHEHLSPRKQVGGYSHYEGTSLKYEVELYQGYINSPQEKLDRFPSGGYDSDLNKFDHSPRHRAMMVEQSELMLEHEHDPDKRHCGITNERSAWKVRCRGDANELFRDDRMNSVRPSKKQKSKSSKYGTTGWSRKKATQLSLGNLSRRTSSHSTGARDIKERLGPRMSQHHVSHPLVKKSKPSLKNRLGPGPKKSLPWLKNFNSQKLPRNQGIPDETVLVQDKDPQEVIVPSAKPEPPENSEDFRQLVHSAFFKFVKQLNETPAKRKKYMEQKSVGSLKCTICGRDSKEYGDVESLVMHALMSTKAGFRYQHLGLHKALCVLMGWKSAEAHDSPWIREMMPDVETSAVKEDLIIWPPVVIMCNTTVKCNNPEDRRVVSIEELDANLRDMGFGDKTKVCWGKPANQSILVVKFSGTLSGLQEAERLHNICSEKQHGRAELQKVVNCKTAGNCPQVASADKLDSALYGYLGIAEDLDKLDFESKKRSLVKSRKEIKNIADAPL